MAAPDIETLLDVETEVERVYRTHLIDAFQLPALASDSAEDVQTPRIEVSAILVSTGPHIFTPATGPYAGRQFFDQHTIQVRLALVYSPEWGQNQGNLRGRMRAAATDYVGIKALLAANDYLRIAADTMRQSGGDRTIDDEEKEETITMESEAVFFFAPTAYPTS